MPEAGGGGDTAHGPGRVLVALYGVFALAAGARAAVQLATRFDEAPLAYLLSALAAVVYAVATVGLAGGRRRTALAACAFELVGVLAVGTLSLADPAAFPDETVWSGYGRGYLFIPLLLPVLGLLWLRRRSAGSAARPGDRARVPGAPPGPPVVGGQNSPPPPKSPPKSPPTSP